MDNGHSDLALPPDSAPAGEGACIPQSGEQWRARIETGHAIARAQAGRDGPRSVSVLGSTGSIGTSSLDLVARNRKDFVVRALVAGRNVSLLAEQARRFDARLAVIAEPGAYRELKDALSGTDIRAEAGEEAVIEAASNPRGEGPADWVMAAITGASGLVPTVAALRAGSMVALANKEALVCAGPLMIREAQRAHTILLPVDSEHNAIFQVLEERNHEQVERLILTASGGPFRAFSRARMEMASPEEALAHPNWHMGAKVSIDSATMMNKGLELIEASFLFGVSEANIEILVHPQSIVHSLVGYHDGSVLAQLGTPDMRTPIAHTLAWPNRMAAPSARLDLAAIGRLDFAPPDLERFPSLRLAREALRSGGAAPAILNAANERAVTAFLDRRIGFLAIAEVVAETLAHIGNRTISSLEEVIDINREAQRIADTILSDFAKRSANRTTFA